MSYYIRVWQSCDVVEIGKHLLILGDLTGDCGACRQLGLDWSTVRQCPSCGTEFRFVASRGTGPLDRNRGATVKRIKERRPDLTFIDHDDYRQLTGKQQARDFFQ